MDDSSTGRPNQVIKKSKESRWREFSSDRPLVGTAPDRLGFEIVARRLAESLILRSPPDGCVVAIEGKWGSGKSSLIELLLKELSNQTSSIETIKFQPWIVGNKEGMLSALFSDLTKAIENVAKSSSTADPTSVRRARQAGESMRRYAVKLGRTTVPLARIAAIFGVPLVGFAADVMERATDAAESVDLSDTIEDLKDKITADLSKLQRRIVVVIDDLDRLEPQEAAEVLRLVRAVADFPKVTYILSFDQEVLSHSLRTALRIRDGRSFLKKMIQVSFKVPRPEAFDIRRWLEDDLLALHASVSKHRLTDDQATRLQQVCGIEGGLLETPREIVRAVNAVKLYWPPVAENVDYVDMVWLQLIRLHNEGLYLWIEKYIADYFAVAGGATVDNAGKIEDAQALKAFTKNESLISPRSLWVLRDFLPGVEGGMNTEDHKLLYNTPNNSEIAQADRERRLSSFHHHHYYFAFFKPLGALDDQEFFELMAEAVQGRSLDERFHDLIKRERPQGGTMLTVLIDRLATTDEQRFPHRAVVPVLVSLSNCMDALAQAEGTARWGRIWTWLSAQKLVATLLPRLSSTVRSNVIRRMFGDGRAIGWLMGELIRGESFAHDPTSDSRKTEHDWILSESELQLAKDLMMDRFAGKDRRRVASAPQLLRVLYGWRECSDGSDLKAWIEVQLQSDERFLKLLSGCRGWMQSDKTYYPLNKRDIENFMDYDSTISRLQKIAGSRSSKRIVRQATELLEAARVGREP